MAPPMTDLRRKCAVVRSSARDHSRIGRGVCDKGAAPRNCVCSNDADANHDGQPQQRQYSCAAPRRRAECARTQLVRPGGLAASYINRALLGGRQRTHTVVGWWGRTLRQMSGHDGGDELGSHSRNGSLSKTTTTTHSDKKHRVASSFAMQTRARDTCAQAGEDNAGCGARQLSRRLETTKHTAQGQDARVYCRTHASFHTTNINEDHQHASLINQQHTHGHGGGTGEHPRATHSTRGVCAD